MEKKKNVVLSLSGGMDSGTLLLRCLEEYENVTAISFDYGQKHRVELERAQELVKYLNENLVRVFHRDFAPTEFEKIYGLTRHRVIKLEGLSELLNSALVEGGEDVPEGHYEQENMKDTVVPNRNKIFASIIQAVALSTANRTGESCDIALGIHAGDHCFVEDTNILTPKGLQTVKSLREGDSIYSFNLENNKWELDTVTAIIKKNMVDTVKQIKTYAGEIALTDEHRVYRLKLGDFQSTHGYSKSIEKVAVSELQVGDYLIQPTGIYNLENTPPINYRIDLKPIVEPILLKYERGLSLSEEGEYLWLGGSSKTYRDKKIPRFVEAKAFVELLAWYIAEGWSSKSVYHSKNARSRYSASFCQSLKANLEKVEYIKEMLIRAEFPVSFEFSKTFHNNIPKEVTFYVSNILSVFLKETGSHSEVKHIPDWLMDILLSSLELRESFLYVLGIADGFNTDELNKGFCTSSPKLLEQVITLLQLSGYHFTLSPKKSRKTTYITYSKLNQKRALISLGEAKFTEILSIEDLNYGKHVYDITVEKNHNFAAGLFGSLLISNSIYPDCRQEFRDADDQAFRLGNWDAEKVQYFTPYLYNDKFDILKDGERLCKEFDIDFNEAYSRTLTSYKPYPSGNSDYKSASSVERILAFVELGRPDPVQYEDETGPVDWEIAKNHALKVEAEHKEG